MQRLAAALGPHRLRIEDTAYSCENVYAASPGGLVHTVAYLMFAPHDHQRVVCRANMQMNLKA